MLAVIVAIAVVVVWVEVNSSVDVVEGIHLMNRIAQTMVVGNVTEELLCIERPAQKKRQVTVIGTNNLAKNIHRHFPGKRVMVLQTILGVDGQNYRVLENFGDPREKRRIHNLLGRTRHRYSSLGIQCGGRSISIEGFVPVKRC